MVVGIDGSHAAVGAALWAVDEAISRDIPLRLLYAIDQTARADTDPQDAAHQLATAEQAVRHVSTAVESTEKPVKIEVEILKSRPTPRPATLCRRRPAGTACAPPRSEAARPRPPPPRTSRW